jgi:hypothetical protein
MKQQTTRPAPPESPGAGPATPAAPGPGPLPLSEDEIFRDPFADFTPSSR